MRCEEARNQRAFKHGVIALIVIRVRTRSGRSRQLCTHCENMWFTIVSLVGRTTSGSASSLPPPAHRSIARGGSLVAAERDRL